MGPLRSRVGWEAFGRSNNISKFMDYGIPEVTSLNNTTEKFKIIFVESAEFEENGEEHCEFLANVRRKLEIASAVASSGIAATLLDGGRTVYSALKLPLNLNVAKGPICNTGKASGMAAY